MNLKIGLRVGAFLACFLVLFTLCTELVKDKRFSFLYDVSRKVNGFYAEPEGSLDFVFVGSSQMFSSIAPAVLWREHGITSYDFGANEQPFWISYHYIQELLKTQRPKAVFLDVFYAFLGEEYQKEGVNRINIDDIHWSKNKIDLINAAVPKEERGAYYWEIMKYHGNWKSLGQTRFEYMFWRENNPYKGYTPFLHRTVFTGGPKPDSAQTAEKLPLSEKNLEYLEKIIELAKREQVNLVLFKTPNGDVGGQKYYNSVADVAEKNGVPFLNLNTVMPGESHNNIMHAEKITSYIGDWIVQHFEVEDKRGNPLFSSWERDAQYYYQEQRNFLLTGETDFSKYLSLLNYPNYMVIFSVRDEASNRLDGSHVSLLKDLGLLQDMRGKYRWSYLAILDGGQVVTEQMGDAPLSAVEALEGKKIEVISQGFQHGSLSSIKIDGQELSRNARGFNIVVYDKLQDKVVDSVAFDTFDQFQVKRG